MIDENGLVNLFTTQSIVSMITNEAALVYGSMRVHVDAGGTITHRPGYSDIYNFDQKVSWHPKQWLRNSLTRWGKLIAGSGTSYHIYFYGSNHVKLWQPMK